MVVTTSVPRRVLEALKGIGLNLYERNLYAALLVKKVATAGELSDLSQVPRARIYDVAESLAEKGFVVIQPGSPIKYIAVEPEEALERLKEKVRRDAETICKRLEEIKGSEIVEEMKALYSKDIQHIKPYDFVGVIKSKEKIDRQIRSLMNKTEKHLHIFTSKKGLMDLLRHRRLLGNLKSKGIKIRILAPITGEIKHIVNELKKVAEIRDSSKIKVSNSKFKIFDDKHILMHLTDDDTEHSQEVALWAANPHLAKNMFLPLFEDLWSKAKKI